MTTQEAYERIRAYFSRDGAVLSRAKFDDLCVCAYRTRINGRVAKCAVGCLIPLRVYDQKIEGRCASSALREIREEYPHFLVGVDEAFLEEAQTSHDSAEGVSSFVLDLDVIAERFGLEVAA